MGAAFDIIHLVCEDHGKIQAEAFCLTHKKVICMSCIVHKSHYKADCNIQEIESADHNLKMCLIGRQVFQSEDETKLKPDEIELKMKTKLEYSYSEALENLEEYRSASYEVTRSKVANLIKHKKDFIAQQRIKLDMAIDHFLSGNMIEGQTIIREIMNERFTSVITFQKEIPSFDTEEKLLREVEKTSEKALFLFDIKSVVESDDSDDSANDSDDSADDSADDPADDPADDSADDPADDSADDPADDSADDADELVKVNVFETTVFQDDKNRHA